METQDMNEAPSNQTGQDMNDDQFSSQPAPQTNPFTADLKGEFTSNFGTNTNAVSQIFKEGGFVGNNRTKYLIIGGAAIVVLAVIFFVMTGGDSSEEQFVEETGSEDLLAEDTEGMMEETGAGGEGEGGMEDTSLEEDPMLEETGSEEMMAEETGAEGGGESTMGYESTGAEGTAGYGGGEYTGGYAGTSGGGASMGSGPISLVEPSDGATISYDETQGPAMFSWEGGGGYIVFSRSSSMSPEIMRVPVSGSSYAFHHPWPGTWYWKVENSSGATEVRSFTVSAPPERNIQIAEPASGASVSGNGGVVSWQGDSAVAFYRVELSDGSSWANPMHRFATSGNSVSLSNVQPGQYELRVGAFSEVSGQWEYTQPISVSVQ